MQASVDPAEFEARVLAAYDEGTADRLLPASCDMARSLMPPSTAGARNFWSMTPELPEFIPSACVGCMECVTECPDTAIVARVIPEGRVAETCAKVADASLRPWVESQWARTKKYADNFEKQGKTAGRFGLLNTMVVSSRSGSAFLTAPPVPRGVSSTA